MNNKDIIIRLIDYLLTQDPKIVARLLANAMLDYYRIAYPHLLTKEEHERLMLRIHYNAQSYADFAKNGAQGDLIVENMAPKDSE